MSNNVLDRWSQRAQQFVVEDWGVRVKFRLLLAALLAVTLSWPTIAAPLKVGAPAPNFELILTTGQHVHLSELRGNVVVLNFWATWCVPCRTELPLLDNYYRVAARRGWPLRIYAVAIEDSVPEYKMKSLFAAMAIPAARRVRGGPFGDVAALPTNYIIDRSGVLRYAKSGAFDLSDLNTILVPLMLEPAADAN